MKATTQRKKIVIALAGNANVGKSVIFNHLTGMHQHIGNWPGKTVERAEGTLHFKGYTIDVVDLPGIYSLSAFSMEELVTRDFIAVENPDLVINVVDASVLERNLFFTLQLLELETPMIVALNQMDMAKKKGIEIDCKELENALGVPVIPTVAPSQTGIHELLEAAIDLIEEDGATSSKIKYGEEVEEKIRELSKAVAEINLPYPARWVAIKLLEGDKQVEARIRQLNPKTLTMVKKLGRDLEKLHGHSCSTVMTSARYEVAGCVARRVQEVKSPAELPLAERLHMLTTNRILGYPIMAVVILSVFVAVFSFGDLTSGLLNEFFYAIRPAIMSALGTGIVGELIWGGLVEGLLAGITVALPYLVPFYFILCILEDSGYLSRVAFLMDNLMHKIGLHGKAFIPMMLGFGCNVPGCLGCRIMETQRERLIAIFVVTLVPCAATSVIVLGLVGAFVGIQWALMLYVVDLIIIFLLGRIAFKVLPGEPTGLIMEMHDYRVPHAATVAKQTWARLGEFIKMAFPLIMAGSFVIKLADIFGLLEPIADILSPVTVVWLGLPVITGIALIFGVLRKELTLIMLATLLGTTDFSQALQPIQMIVFALVAMLYIPCISTIGALVRELGWRKAWFISVFEIAFAVIIGGLAYRVMLFAGF